MTNTCTWIGPVDDQYARLESTCCNAVVKGRSYCEQHLWQVYKEGTAVRRKKDTRRYEQIKMLESLMNEAIAELEQEGFDVWGDSERLEA